MAEESEITSEILDDTIAAAGPVPKILVAEDIPDLRDAIVIWCLVNRGLPATASKPPPWFPAFDPDLVILDMRMPRTSGADACADIRKTSNVPIITFTSTNDAAEVSEAIVNGATDFVLKTTGVTEPTGRVKFHLENPNQRPRKAKIQTTVVANAVNQASGKVRGPIKTTILVIDPDDATRATVKSVLTRLNQNIIETRPTAEAIPAFWKHRPHILVTE